MCESVYMMTILVGYLPINATKYTKETVSFDLKR